MLSMFFFNAQRITSYFFMHYLVSHSFFFSGFNTAIYAIIPDCVEYGEWKTGLRNDGFQYAFISLGNKIGMAVGTALLSRITWKIWLYCKSDTKCNCTFNYETCIYDDSRCTVDCDCGCIIFLTG